MRGNANVLFLLCSLMPARIQREVTNRFSLLRLPVSVSAQAHLLSSCRVPVITAIIVFERQNFVLFNFFSSFLRVPHYLKQSMELHLGP